MATKTIKVYSGSAGNWQPTEVSSSTVGELRTELDIPNGSSCNVNGTVVGNDHEVADDAFVAFSSNDKTGGKAKGIA